LTKASEVVGVNVRGLQIRTLLDNLPCSSSGRHGYFRALRAFYNWLYSAKSRMNLNPQTKPMLLLEAPEVEKRILPSLATGEIGHLLAQAQCVRDKAIISLFADSVLRLSELANIDTQNID
jgi:site-specific recombinase XerC